MTDTVNGFYQKFVVLRKSNGEELPWDETFTLIPSRDPHAKVALNAYADSIEDVNPTLSSELRSHFEL